MGGVSTEAKVGLFTLALLVVLFWATFHLSTVGGLLAGGTRYHARVSTVHQIGVDSVVEVAGVRVGRVASVGLLDGGQAATFAFTVDDQVTVYRDAELRVQTVGFLGDRYVNLIPGTPAAGVLPAGAEITNATVPGTLEEFMDKLTPMMDDVSVITAELRALLTDPEVREGIPQTLASLRRSSQLLEDLVVGYETFIADFIVNSTQGAQLINERLPELFDRLYQQVGDADETLERMADAVTDGVDTLNRITRTFEGAAEDIREIVAGIERGEGTIGTLLRNEETAREVRQVVTQINDNLARVDRLKTIVNYLGQYHLPGSGGQGEGFVHRAELRVQPAYDRYYSVGIVSRTEDVESRKETTIIRQTPTGTTQYTETQLVRDDKLLFNFQLAKRFWDLTLRGGVIESEGGVGIDYALFDDRFWLRSEAFDFNRSGDRPRVRSWAELRLFNHLTVAAGVEDAIGTTLGPRASFGAGIIFSDEDLKLLFSSLPSVSVD